MLSPLGMVSIRFGGLILLTCEMKSVLNSSLHWTVTVSFPHLATTCELKIVPNQRDLSEFKIGFTGFSIARISESPLISYLLVNNVTAEITIYCSEDGNENGAPMTVIYVIYKGDYVVLYNGII